MDWGVKHGTLTVPCELRSKNFLRKVLICKMELILQGLTIRKKRKGGTPSIGHGTRTGVWWVSHLPIMPPHLPLLLPHQVEGHEALLKLQGVVF